MNKIQMIAVVMIPKRNIEIVEIVAIQMILGLTKITVIKIRMRFLIKKGI